MYLLNKFLLFLLCILFSKVIAVPAHLQPIGQPLYELFVEEDGELVPLNRSNPSHILPWPGYEGLPMKTQWNEFGEVEHVVLIELLDIHQYRKHFLTGPSWANFELSDEDVEDIRQSHFNKSYDPRPYAAAKLKRLQKRDPYFVPQHCGQGVVYTSKGEVKGYNPNSRGFIHLATEQICNPVKGSRTATMQHSSTLGFSISSKDIPFAQQAAKNYLGKFTKYALGFIKELGLGFSASEADSVSYSFTYQADCGFENSACFLTEQPTVIVRKGNAHHEARTPEGARCPDFDFETTHWEGHDLYSYGDSRAAIWDVCYTTNECFQFKPVIPPGRKECPPNAVPYSHQQVSSV